MSSNTMCRFLIEQRAHTSSLPSLSYAGILKYTSSKSTPHSKGVLDLQLSAIYLHLLSDENHTGNQESSHYGLHRRHTTGTWELLGVSKRTTQNYLCNSKCNHQMLHCVQLIIQAQHLHPEQCVRLCSAGSASTDTTNTDCYVCAVAAQKQQWRSTGGRHDWLNQCGLIENYGVPEESRKPQRASNGRISAEGVDVCGPYFANYVT